MILRIWTAFKVFIAFFFLGALVGALGEFVSPFAVLLGYFFWFVGGYLAYRILRGSRAPKMKEVKGSEGGVEEYDK